MKPRRRVGLQSPSRRRIQSLDIMTSCSSLLIQTTRNLREFDGSSRPQTGLRLQQGRDHLIVMINIALLCTNVSPAVRPATPSVVNMLEGRIAVQDICF
ncbi:hypothetical protein AAG906_019489 [Vitis piasezkii]